MTDDVAKPGAESVAARHGVDPKLLEMLACPLTKAPLSWNAQTGELISKAARLAFPVRDGVPIMLPSEARTLEQEEFSR
ncbi:Trm112 family protein [Mesorhizobium sp. CAU 1741]|uniref:Trm112 family protein n=1 Tax=Mesorhizobium sp. CAU 1741 TaxID=3140366 RepID=UPI00325B7EFD